MVDRVAGVRVPVIVRLGDDVLTCSDGGSTPVTGQRTVRVFDACLETPSQCEDMAWGHTRDVRPPSIQRLWKMFLEVTPVTPMKTLTRSVEQKR